jgi:hypothetical protein
VIVSYVRRERSWSAGWSAATATHSTSAFAKGRDLFDLAHALDSFDGMDESRVVTHVRSYLALSGQAISRAQAQERMFAKLKRVECAPRTHDRYGRTVAVCRADGVDLWRGDGERRHGLGLRALRGTMCGSRKRPGRPAWAYMAKAACRADRFRGDQRAIEAHLPFA